MRRLFSLSQGHALSNHVARRGLLFAGPPLLALVGTIGIAAAASGFDAGAETGTVATPTATAPVLGGDVSPLLASFQLAADTEAALEADPSASPSPSASPTESVTPTASATTTETPTATPTGEPTATASFAAHTNGHGCDDLLFADGEHVASFGGPVGCEVGNSAAHRQNGLHGNGAATAAPTDTVTETPTTTPTGAASLTGSLDAGLTTHGNSGNARGNSKK